MKYIIINDIYTCFKKYKFYILGYMISIIGFMMVKMLTGISLDNDLFYDTLGLNTTISSHILTLIIYVLHLIFSLFITITVLTTNIKSGVENVFLRMSLTKWITIKLISIILISCLLKLVVYILVLLIYSLSGNVISDFILSFLINNIFLIIIELIFILIYIICKKYQILTPIILLVLLIGIPNLIISIIDIKEYILLMLIIMFSLIFIIIKNSKKYIHIFE